MLPKEHRLRANPDFRRVYARGRSHVHELAVLHVLRRKPEDVDSTLCRVGFVVSKKQGDAVVRNRIKRRLREAMRLRWADVRSGPFDLVFVGRSRLKTAEWAAVTQALETLLRRANMLHSPRD